MPRCDVEVDFESDNRLGHVERVVFESDVCGNLLGADVRCKDRS
jgi:hypothetical protein